MTVTSSGSAYPDALSPGAYVLMDSYLYWTGTGFTPDSAQCHTSSSNADLQELQLTLADNETGSSGNDTTTILLASTGNLISPTETISGPTSNQALGASFSYTASLAGSPTPTGSVTWSFTGAPTGTACSGGNTVTLAAGSAACAVATAQAGTYTATATYTGDSNWTGTASDSNSSGGVDTVTVNQGQPTMTTTCPGCSQTVGSTISFTATLSGLVAGIAPAGSSSVAWTFPNNAPAGAACSNANSNTLTTNGTTATATCQVTPALAGNYNPTATFSGDSNYLTASGHQANQNVNTKLTPTSKTTTPSSTASVGSSVTFTDTVTGVTGVTPTGNVNWSFPGANCSGGNSVALTASGPGSATATAACTVTSVANGTYQPTALYGSDSDYNSSSDNSAVVVVTGEAPTVIVSGSPGSGKTESLVFTATVTPLNGPDPTPTGTIAWTVTQNGSAVTCNPSTGTLVGVKKTNTASVSCTISPSSPLTYNATAVYTPDANSSSTYTSATGTGSSTG